MSTSNKHMQDTLNKMKTVATVAMFFVHSVLFYALYNKVPALPELDIKTKLIFVLSFFSLTIPAIAGAELRLRINNNLINNKLIKYPIKAIFKILILLCFVDFIKSILASGFIYGFRWDVLPLISVSILFILFVLNQYSLFVLAIVFPFIFLVEPLLVKILSQYTILTHQQALNFTISSNFQLWMVLSGATIAILIWKVMKNILFKNRSSLAIDITCLSTVLIFIYSYAYYWKASPMFAAAIRNFPIAAWVETNEVGGHIWSIFPWSGLVIAGFLFQHLLIKQPRIYFLKNISVVQILVSIAFCIFAIFFLKYFSFFYNLLSDVTYFTARIFTGRDVLCLLVICYYIIFHYMTYLLSLKWPTQENVIFKFFGSGILINYVVQYIMAARLSPVAAKLFSDGMGLWYYFIFTTFCSLAVSFLMIYIYQSRIVISFRKKSINDH